MCTFKPLIKKDLSCIGFFYSDKDKDLRFLVLDSESKYVVWENFERVGIVQLKDIKQFVNGIPKMFGKCLKAVIIQIFELFNIPGYGGNGDLCNHFKTIFETLHVPYCFLSQEQEKFSTMIAAADLNYQPMDKLFAIVIFESVISMKVLEYTSSGYIICGISYKEIGHMFELFDEVVAKHQPRNILLCEKNLSSHQTFTSFEEKLIEYGNLISLKLDFVAYTKNFIEEMGKWILDKSSCKYYVHPSIFVKSWVLDPFDKALMSFDYNETLPKTHSCFLPKGISYVTELHYDSWNAQANRRPNQPQKRELNQRFHRNKITISMDSNYFYNFQIQPITLTNIKTLPGTLPNKSKSKIPVIGFCDNFSVICLYNPATNDYHFAESWNGIHGTELVINFSGEKPICCKQITSIEETSPQSEFIVYDLIEIMSMPPDAMKIEEYWGFKITKNDENPVILEFNSLQGTKLSTPEFLMALLIKEHRKIIKAEIGEKPEKLGFCILDEKYDVEEKKRIKKGLKDSCKLLEVDCEFIEI